MPNARHITQQIAEFLATRGGGATGRDVAGLATAYAELSRQAHERLGRCHDYIARGLRSEAVQEADLEPALLGVLAALDLEAFESWDDYCRKHDLTRPYPMSRGVAQELNRAYAADQLVAPLLREYRFRCLSRGPMVGRIAALRGVAGIDKNNRVWHESLVELETARIAELRIEVEKNLANADQLRNIQRELLDDRRRIKAPASLVERVESALLSSMVAKAQQDLRSLLPALDEAYSAMDYRACHQLLESWNQTLKSVGQSHLHLPDDLRQPVQPIIDWVQTQAYRQQQDALFRAACGRLSEVIDGQPTLEELKRSHEHVASFELPLPDALAENHRRATHRLELAAARRKRFRLASAGAAVVLLSVGVGWAINRQLAEREINQGLAGIGHAVEEHQLASANEQWDALLGRRPAMAGRDEAKALREKLDEAIKQETQRLGDFTALLAQLQQAHVSTITSADVDRLAGLARLEEEAQQSQQLRDSLDVYRQQQARQRDAEVLAQGAALRDRLTSIQPEQIDRQPRDVIKQLSAAQAELIQLQAAPALSGSTRAALDAVQKRAEALRQAADFVVEQQDLAQQQALSLQQIRTATGSAKALAGALEHFSTRYAQTSPLAEDFARAAADAEAWRAVEAWRELLHEVGASKVPTDLTGVAQRVRDVDGYLASHPHSPVLGDARAYRAYWGRALLASSDTGPWLSKLPKILRAPVIRDLNAFMAGGKRYYLVGQGSRRETSLGTTLDVVLTPDITRSKTINLKPGVAGPIGTSPQSRLAGRLLTMIAEYDLTQSDTFHLDVLEAVLTDREVDPVLRSVLATLVIDQQETMGQLDAGLSLLRSRLSANSEKGLNWLDPNDLAAATVREQLKALMENNLPDFAQMRSDARKRRATLGGPLRSGRYAQGVLMRPDNTPSVEGLTSALSNGWEAFVAVKNTSPDAGYQWRRVGVVREKQVQLIAAKIADLPSGGMVFFLPPEASRAGAPR